MWTKKNIFIVLLCISLKSFGQNENVFIDRTYWKTNPSIKNIDQKISEGHDISALSWSSFDAVSYALLEKVDNRTIEYLLTKQGNGVNKLTHDGRSYIFWAAYKDNLEIMELLLNLGADTSIIDSHGYSLINFAATTGQLNTKLYDFCIKNGCYWCCCCYCIFSIRSICYILQNAFFKRIFVCGSLTSPMALQVQV